MGDRYYSFDVGCIEHYADYAPTLIEQAIEQVPVANDNEAPPMQRKVNWRA
jgi:hypothetical protein